jgi:hypothetical protein
VPTFFHAPAMVTLTSLWLPYRQNWNSTLRSMFDGLICGMLTAGAFGAFSP